MPLADRLFQAKPRASLMIPDVGVSCNNPNHRLMLQLGICPYVHKHRSQHYLGDLRRPKHRRLLEKIQEFTSSDTCESGRVRVPGGGDRRALSRSIRHRSLGHPTWRASSSASGGHARRMREEARSTEPRIRRLGSALRPCPAGQVSAVPPEDHHGGDHRREPNRAFPEVSAALAFLLCRLTPVIMNRAAGRADEASRPVLRDLRFLETTSRRPCTGGQAASGTPASGPAGSEVLKWSLS